MTSQSSEWSDGVARDLSAAHLYPWQWLPARAEFGLDCQFADDAFERLDAAYLDVSDQAESCELMGERRSNPPAGGEVR